MKLSSKAADDAIRRWFLPPGATDAEVANARAILLMGFKKITAACNSGKVLFSDRPHLRMDPDYDTTFASVNPNDTMPVIYIYDYLMKNGRRNAKSQIPKLWLFALTIVHELTHKTMGTEDHRYDADGLKPSTVFPPSMTLVNADSWAYFCGDLAGTIPKSAVRIALR